MRFKNRIKYLLLSVLLLLSKPVFANEINKMGDVFVFAMAVFAFVVFFFLLPFFFFIKSKFSLWIFSSLNLLFFLVNRFYWIPEDMFLTVLFWFHGAIQAVAILTYYTRKKDVTDEKID